MKNPPFAYSYSLIFYENGKGNMKGIKIYRIIPESMTVPQGPIVSLT